MKSSLQIAGFTLAGLLSLNVPTHAALPSQVGETPVPSLAPMIKKVSPTVVGIATSGTIKDQGPRNPLLDDPFFRRFFDMPPDAGPRERPFEAAGSGVVIDAQKGYIITNAHVVKNASEITITTNDNRELKAELVGADSGSDIAVLKIKQGKLNAISMGDSTKVEVGDFVIAIGNPFGLQHTVTSGIVSALGRAPRISPDSYEDFIQTDASINPGNSGGALVNLRGELVGINSAILSQSGGNIGIGFAIPVNMVKSVMEQLIKYGEVKRGLLGVRISTLTPNLREALGAPPDTQGALVAEVNSNSAAEKAGIKTKDIITFVNGQAVRSDSELRNAIGMLRIGEKVEVGLLRDGKPRKVTAVLTEASDQSTAKATELHSGLEGADLKDAQDGNGVLVSAVEAGSPAAQFGLRANDVIVGANKVRIKNLQQLRKASEDVDSLILEVRRGNSTVLVIIR